MSPICMTWCSLYIYLFYESKPLFARLCRCFPVLLVTLYMTFRLFSNFSKMKWYITDDYDGDYPGYNMADLTFDQFYLNINFSTPGDYQELYLYSLNEDCYKCPYLLTHYGNGSREEQQLSNNIFHTNTKFRISMDRKEYLPQDEFDNIICDLDNNNFGQFGIYSVDVNQSGCFVNVLKEPVNIYTPILTAILLNILLYLVFWCTYFLWRKWISKASVADRSSQNNRVKSLDTFRGLSIVVMIFANFGCGGYKFFAHAIWNGLHIADLVFPWFIWIMGVCIPITLSSSFKKKVPVNTIILNIIKRSLKLYCLGIFLNGGADLKYLRLFGVLQRFSVAYLVISIVCVYCMDRYENDENHSEQVLFADISRIWRGWVIVSVLLFIHTVIIFTIAAPGCPRGYMGPGGLHKNMSYKECIGGATGYIDGLILGNHIYQKPTISDVYEARPFDPEGIVGCLTTIFQTFIGVQAGTTLLAYKNHSQKLLLRWLIWAVVIGIIGGCLCDFSKEEGLIPVNKNVWSLSFVMVTSSFAYLMLSLCYVLIDVMKWWSGKPFLFAGMNAILLYIGHEMTDGHFPVRWYFHNDSNVTDDPRRTHFLALLSDLWGAGIWVLISFFLYKMKIFFTL